MFVTNFIYKSYTNLLAIAQFAGRRLLPLWIIPKDKEAQRIGNWRFGRLKRERMDKVFPDLADISINIENLFDRETDMSIDVGEIAILNALIKLIKAKKVLEIGTFDGNTALNIASNIPNDGIVYTVDLPEDKTQDIPMAYNNSIKDEQIGLQYKNSPHKHKIKQILSDSTKLEWKKINTPLDLMFIDGCHYYQVVKKDTANALKYVRKGGLIVWHDYGMIPDVSRVVDETSKQIKVHAIRGTRLAIGINS